jgi:hypothetical protein
VDIPAAVEAVVAAVAATPTPAAAPVESAVAPTPASVPTPAATSQPTISAKAASDITAVAEALDSALSMNDFRSAKSFLLKTDSSVSGSLYEHLSHVLLQILQQKPQNALGECFNYSPPKQ